MIDLHCHLLPEVDDGPETLAESIAMARAAYEDGVRTIVVTPHEGPWLRRHSPGADSTLKEEVRHLEEQVQQAGIPLALYPGLEIELDLDVVARLRAGRAHPLGSGPYVLLELPPYQRVLYLEQVIFEAQLAGWWPVLAHAERYAFVQENPRVLAPLVQRGVLVQVTVRSLTGEVGRAARETALRLLRQGLAHVLATDGHSASGPRRPVLSPGVAVAACVVGPARAEDMVVKTPQRILLGLPLD